MNPSNEIDWSLYDNIDWSLYDGSFDHIDDQPFSSLESGSGRPVHTSGCFAPASNPLDPSDEQILNVPTNSIQSSHQPNSLLPYTGCHSTQTHHSPYQSQNPMRAGVAMPPQGLVKPLDLTSGLDFTIPPFTAAAAALPAAPPVALPADVALSVAPSAAPPSAPAALPAVSAADPPQEVAPAAPSPDVVPPATLTKTLKRKRESSEHPPEDSKRPKLNRKYSSVTRVSVPPSRQDIMKTCSVELLLLLADASPIIATAKAMAAKSGIGLPSFNFLSTFIRRYCITGRMFLTSGFWSLLLGDGLTSLRHACIPKLAGLLKIVEAARSHSPDYKARVQAWAKAFRQPYDPDRAHLFKLRPSDTLLRAIALVIGPVSYAQVKDISFPGGSCRIRGARGSKIVTWSPEPEVVIDDERL